MNNPKIWLNDADNQCELRIDWPNDRHQAVEVRGKYPQDFAEALKEMGALINAEVVNGHLPSKNDTCKECHGDNYILIGCCSGRECGCMGQPVQLTNCNKCNPDGDKKAGDEILKYTHQTEYIGV